MSPTTWYGRSSIKVKLVIMMLAVSSTVLLLTAALSLAQTIHSGRQRLHRVLEVNANLLGEYCVVPLSFYDREEADRMLSRIQLIPGLLSAELYDQGGTLFAHHDPSGQAPLGLSGDASARFRYGEDSWTYRHEVTHMGLRLGTLVLQAGLAPLRKEVLRHAGILAAIFAFLILVTYLLALRMQSLISRPILHLAEAARRVSEEGDLGRRVHRSHRDEIGTLYDGYNRMLDQLQSRLKERDKAEDEARIRQQQLLEAGKLVTLGTLVSGVAHEINNPNGYIMLSASLALKKLGHDEPAARSPASSAGSGAGFLVEILTNIHRSSQRIDSIVRRLKDYYRKDQARAKAPVDVNEVVENAIQILDAKIRNATRNFRFQRGEDVPQVLGNFQELEQVMINLIENACQALRDPDGEVEVRTVRLDEKGVQFQVRDTGGGIPKDYLERITDPFFTTKRESGGTGLGLSLALSIVTDHGGTLGFESKPGEGTLATVTIKALTAS